MDYLSISLLVFVSYFVGSIPFGFVISKLFFNIDIRDSGSGNTGATNVLRVAGKSLGIITLICDVLKAVIVVLLAKLFPEYQYLPIICSFLVVIGHIFPIWLDFKGGKGVASFVAILFVINPIIALIFGSIWLLTFAIFRISSLSSVIASSIIPVFAFYLNFDQIEMMFLVSMSLLILIRHKSNIIRLLNNEEKRILNKS